MISLKLNQSFKADSGSASLSAFSMGLAEYRRKIQSGMASVDKTLARQACQPREISSFPQMQGRDRSLYTPNFQPPPLSTLTRSE